jgi:hypothetical protein
MDTKTPRVHLDYPDCDLAILGRFISEQKPAQGRRRSERRRHREEIRWL